jgi:hypothetical protein
MGIKEEFFAAADSNDIANVLSQKTEEYINYIMGTANFKRMRKAWQMYYGLTKQGNVASSDIREAGPDGEYSLITVNHFRNLIQHLLVMTTNQRPAGECQAANSDFDAQSQCILGNQLLDYYMREKKVARYLRSLCEMGLVLTEGYIALDWDTSLGNIYAVGPDGRPRFEGDIQFKTFTPFDVVKDPYRKDTELPWVTTVEWVNKYNLAAKYPELEDKILGCQADKLFELRNNFMINPMVKSDLIPLQRFRHSKCEALPQGRMVHFLDRDIMLFDGPLPYDDISVYRLSPGDQMDTPWGYSAAFDLMGPQDAYNLLASIALTNQKTFGVGSIVAPHGANVNYQQLADGLSLITANERNGQIRALNLTNTPAEIFNFMGTMEQAMQTLSAVNSVIRGQPEANVASGAFAALLASQAIQFNSGLQESYAQCSEDVMTGVIKMLQKFAKTERVARIVGEENQFMLESFSSESLSQISKVTVSMANPLTKTTAGRMKMAEDLSAAGHLKRPEQYFQVMETGNLRPVVEHEETANMLIKKENEMLRRGMMPMALKTDKHQAHILEHLSVLDDPDKRLDPKVAQTVTTHVQGHIDFLQTLDPSFLLAIGQQPMMPPQLPGGPQPVQGANPGAPSSSVVEGNPVDQKQPQLPSMPKNALTGQPADSESNLPPVG